MVRVVYFYTKRGPFLALFSPEGASFCIPREEKGFTIGTHVYFDKEDIQT